MNKLYTNIEQGKRLIKSGVPIESADCKIDSFGNITVRSDEDIKNGWTESNMYFPCWSFGNLVRWSIESYCDSKVEIDEEWLYSVPVKAIDKYVENAIEDIVTGIKDGYYGIRKNKKQRKR